MNQIGNEIKKLIPNFKKMIYYSHSYMRIIMYTDSLIEILALLDLSTLHKISFKSKQLFDIYNCDRFWRMKLKNEDLLDLDYLIDPLYSNSTSKEIYEQYEKYQRRFDILSTALRRHRLNHCHGKIVQDDHKFLDNHKLSKRLLDQRDDIKTLSISEKSLGVPVNSLNSIMTIIADYVTSKFHNLIYLDISYNFIIYFPRSDEDYIGSDNIHDLKRILDHPSIIFVNICEIVIQLFDSSFNEQQLRKLIWIPEPYIEKQEKIKQLQNRFQHIKWPNDYFERKCIALHHIPNSIKHMKDDIITWHRRFYDIVNPYTAK
jgi:hypothetical protein